MTTQTRRRAGRVAIAVAFAALCATPSSAQSPPPIPGATGVVVPEGGGGDGAAAVGAATGKVIEGTRQILRAIGIGKGERAANEDPLKSLELGATVVVRYDADVAALDDRNNVSPGRQPTEGRVIELDRRKGVIVVRLADRTTETLQLAQGKGREATANERALNEPAGLISVSYVDAAGDRVVILFRKAS